MSTRVILDLAAKSTSRGEIAQSELDARYIPPPPAAARAAATTLSRADFFSVLAAAAALQPGEPRIVDWLKAQISASSLPDPVRALYLDRIDTAVEFPRIDPELGDVMTPLGALFGLSSAEVDDLFLGEAVSIDRADCPLTLVTSIEARMAALEAALTAQEGS